MKKSNHIEQEESKPIYTLSKRLQSVASIYNLISSTPLQNKISQFLADNPIEKKIEWSKPTHKPYQSS